MTSLLAMVCIVLGFVSAVIDEPILFPALVWFVAAIAFNTLTLPAFSFGRKQG